MCFSTSVIRSSALSASRESCLKGSCRWMGRRDGWRRKGGNGEEGGMGRRKRLGRWEEGMGRREGGNGEEGGRDEEEGGMGKEGGILENEFMFYH